MAATARPSATHRSSSNASSERGARGTRGAQGSHGPQGAGGMKANGRGGRPAVRSRADEVYAEVKRDIGEFRLVPGYRFSENELCERLGVSRTPVRQALVRLQQEGLIEVLFRSGWRVLPFDFERFEQLYELRMVIEAAAVQKLCGGEAGIDEELLRQLAGIWLVPAGKRLKDTARVADLDEAFHTQLVSAAGNQEMARVHREVTERIRIIRRLDFTQAARIAATYEEHGEILRAVQHKRAAQAAMPLRAHIATSQAEVRKITLHQFHLARQAGERGTTGG